MVVGRVPQFGCPDQYSVRNPVQIPHDINRGYPPRDNTLLPAPRIAIGI